MLPVMSGSAPGSMGCSATTGYAFEHILLGRETLTDAVSALLSDKNGGFWVGTYTGLLHYADGVPAKNKGVLLLKDKLSHLPGAE